MPSCASEISPLGRSGLGCTRRRALTGTRASGPAAAPPAFPARGGRAARGGGGAHPALPDSGRSSCRRNPFSPPGPGAEPGESPLPALTLPAAEGRAEPEAPPPLQVFQRRRRHSGERSRLCRRGRPPQRGGAAAAARPVPEPAGRRLPGPRRPGPAASWRWSRPGHVSSSFSGGAGREA